MSTEKPTAQQYREFERQVSICHHALYAVDRSAIFKDDHLWSAFIDAKNAIGQVLFDTNERIEAMQTETIPE